jgi:RNA-directed DNA polymerase
LPSRLLGQRWRRMGRQKSAEAIVVRGSGRRAEHDEQGGSLDFEEMTQRKTEQLSLDFNDRGEARKRWSKGRLVSWADEPGRAETPAVPALAEGLIEAMLSGKKAETALRKVEANKGAPGVDGMRVEELKPYLRSNWSRLKKDLLEGKYRPKPVRRVSIAKPDGGTRELGVPTAVDRFIQQMILQVLEPLYDPTFSPSSYGFRPRRSAKDAVRAAREHVASGNGWVVDIDLEKFFDRVNHDILLGRLARRIGDKKLLKLIRLYLQAGVMLNGLVVERYEGTPQGGPLSPLLSNILLDELDKELESRGHKFCRYADDCNIYVKTERAGQRVMESVTEFLERRLKLKVNREKSAVGKPGSRKFLGLRILRGAKAVIGVAPKSVDRLKRRVRDLTRRNRGVSFDKVLADLKRLTDGWVGYFCVAQTPSLFQELDSWIRRRLRCYVYKQWKKPKNRAKQMIKRGVGPWLAWGVAYNGHGLWKIAGSPAMTRALTNTRLEQQGYSSLYKRYLALTS